MERFSYLYNKIKNNQNVKIISENIENLEIKLVINNEFNLVLSALYGDAITQKLFRQSVPVSNLLLLKYDDIWLSQLLAIDERAMLLKFGNNCIKTIKDLLKKDSQLRDYYNLLIDKEGDGKILEELMDYIFGKYDKLFEPELVPQSKNRDLYIADVIQVLASADA